MSVPETFRISEKTEVPLMNLRGKPYLQVAHRLVWLTETYSRYSIESNYLLLNEVEAIVRTTVTLFDDNGMVQKSATATKKETKTDFADFVEKAETGSLGRALAMLGMGTQFCIQDMDEGERLADSPIPTASKAASSESTFNKRNKRKPKETSEAFDAETSSTSLNKADGGDDGWE